MANRASRLPVSQGKFFVLAFHLLLFGASSIPSTSPTYAQSAAPGSQNDAPRPLAYDVVSIRPYSPNSKSGEWWRTAPNGFSAAGTTVQLLVMGAYSLVMQSQISGLPDWAISDQYSIQAKMDEETAAALQKLPPRERGKQQDLMTQELLADRFQLKVHDETKDLPVFEMVVAKSGLKMKEALPGETERGVFSSRKITAQATQIKSLTHFLAGIVGRIVVDKTGVTGKYDFELKWTPENEPESADSGPSIYAALEEQLGLKLIPAKAPVDTIVVDHIEHPTEN